MTLRQPKELKEITVLSLGAGVQSTTILLRSLKQESGFPHLDAAIFADTGYEPKSVYEHLARLQTVCEESGLPLYVVKRESPWAEWKNQIPVYCAGTGRSVSMTGRQCTKDYKIQPIRAKVRELLGTEPAKWVPRGYVANQVIGISADEAHRMRVPPEFWLRHVYPLVDLGLTRQDCLDWLAANWPYRVSRSSCWCCSFRGSAEWADLKTVDREDWRRAVEFDKELRRDWPSGMLAEPYLHQLLKPLDEVDLSVYSCGLFSNECLGMCGD